MPTLTKILTVLALLTLVGSKGYAQPGCCIADAGADKNVCVGGSVKIGGDAPGSDTCNNSITVLYRWEPATGLNDVNAANPIASPSQTTTYTLHIYFKGIGVTANDTLCHTTDVVTVSVSGNCSVMPKENNSGLDDMQIALAVRNKRVLRRNSIN